MPPTREHQPESPWRGLFVAVLLGLVVFGVVIGTAWVGDDALISFQQVRLFVAGEGMTWNPGMRVQAFTHPAWFFVLSVGHWLSGGLYWPTLIVSAALSMAAVVLLWDFARRQPAFEGRATLAFLFALLTLMSPGFLSFATSGLETPLSYFLTALVIRSVWRGERGIVLWLLLALLVLNRMDHAVLFGPLALWLAHAAWRERRLGAMVPGCLLLLAWFGFATVYFGSPLPNTYFAKLDAGMPLDGRLLRGGYYFQDAALHETFALVVVVIGIIAAATQSGRGRMLALGLTLHLLYLFYIGGDFMRGRFLAVPFLVSMFVIAAVLRPARTGWPALTFVALALVAGRIPQISTDYASNDAFFGIVDERGWYYPLYGAFSRQRHWFQPAREWQPGERPSSAIIGCGQIGAHRLVSPSSVQVVDICGLTDPFIARLPAPLEPGWRTGHLPRRLPLNYDQVVTGRAERLTGGWGQELYDEIDLISRGPLLDGARLAVILRRLVGLGAVAPPVYRDGGTEDLFLDDGTGPKPYGEALAARDGPRIQE